MHCPLCYHPFFPARKLLRAGRETSFPVIGSKLLSNSVPCGSQYASGSDAWFLNRQPIKSPIRRFRVCSLCQGDPTESDNRHGLPCS